MKLIRYFRRENLVLGVVVALAGFGLLTTISQVSAAGDPATELKTALTHAGFAAKADAVKQVTQHLHHVLNCAVGPQGQGFDAAAGNPCQGQGNGFLPDLKAAKGEDAQYYQAWWVAQIAAQAIASNNLGEAKAGAQIVSLVLEDAMKAK